MVVVVAVVVEGVVVEVEAIHVAVGLEEAAEALASNVDVETVFVVEVAADVHKQLTAERVKGVDAFSF